MVRRILKLLSVSVIALSLSGKGVFAQENSMDQSADQDQGRYQQMDMSYAGFGSIGMIQSAWLDPLQNLGEGQSKPAYSKYYWSPDLVLPIRLREGMVTLINFPEWELIEEIIVGDNSSFDGNIVAPNSVMLTPARGANVGVDTNVILFGRSGNRYAFYVRSEGVNTERLTNSIIDIDVIGDENGGSGSGRSGWGGSAGARPNASFGKGNSKSVASTYTKRFQKEDWIQDIPVDPEQFRFDIEVYVPNPDDVVIAPERVWRDNIFTYIDLGNKALNMNQRPIVTLINEKVETPVGFRTRGPNNRLIVVEAIGDMVMRNGKRIICLKLRRSDDAGLENTVYSDNLAPGWDVPPALANGDFEQAFGPSNGVAPYGQAGGNGGQGANPYVGNGGVGGQGMNSYGRNSGFGGVNGVGGFNGGANVVGEYDINTGNSEIIIPQYANGGQNAMSGAQGMGAGGGFAYSNMQRLQNQSAYNAQSKSNSKFLSQYGYGTGFADANTNISIELGTDADVEKLEQLWGRLSSKYNGDLLGFEPYYSVDTPADGQGKELFHLRIGPVKSLEEGDAVCSKLGRNGVFCSVVRTQ